MMGAMFPKEAVFRETLRSMERVVVAYSGGVDSALLADMAHELLGSGSVAVTAVSPSLSTAERVAARSLALARGWSHEEVTTLELEREAYAANGSDRCYWCKVELFTVLEPLAAERSAQLLVGTNADDLTDFRPGRRAARERGVRAPLAEAGLTKEDVRDLARRRSLSVADKPASPCLASRLAYGVRVTDDALARIERAEAALRELGFGVLRVRDHGDLARVEVPAAEIERAAALHSEIVAGLKEAGFAYVTLDLAGFRSGSLNEGLLHPKMLDQS